MIRQASVLALAMTLGACAGLTHVTDDYVQNGSSILALDAQARHGAVPTVVIGSPFANTTPADLLRPVQMPFTAATRNLAPAWPEAEVRLVLIFNPTQKPVSFKTCDRPVPVTPAAPDNRGSTVVVVAYCSGERLNSFAIATGPTPAGVDDPAYASLVEAGLSAALPPPNTGASTAGSMFPF